MNIKLHLPMGEIFGGYQLDGIDVQASEDAYIAFVECSLVVAFPAATIEIERVRSGLEQVSVFTEAAYPISHEKERDVRAIIDEVWRSFEWVVETEAPVQWN